MDRFERRELKSEAQSALTGAAYCPGKLVLIHTAISSGLALLIALVSFLLDQKIAGTSGLGGVGSRAILESIQSFLQTANLILLPFWTIGLTWVFIRISRYQGAEPRDLPAGLRNIGPVLRTKLLQVFLLGGMAFGGCYLGMFVYSMLPVSHNLTTVMEPYLTEGAIDYAGLMEDPAFLSSALWSLPFMLCGMLVLVIPMYYRIRMMDYVLFDHPEKGALHAMRASRTWMRGNRWNLFKLDLSFWWFFLLEILVTLLSFGDMILLMLGVDLGVSQTVLFFVFYVLALAAQVGLYVWKKPLLLTTYARFYDTIQPQEENL